MFKKLILSILLGLTILTSISSQDPPEFQITMLKINEVRSTGDFDYIEIYNTAPFGIMFPNGWYLLDGKLNYEEAVSIPEGTIINSDSFLLVIPDQESVQISLPEGISIIYATESFNFGLTSGDEVRLMYNQNSQEIIVDILGWGGGANTWGYYPDGSSELYDNLIPTPGKPNVPFPDLLQTPTLRINEIQTKGASMFPYDFVELYNYGASSVSGKGISITDSNGSPNFELPEDLIIDPGEYVALIPNEFDQLTIEIQNIILNSSFETTFGLGKIDSVQLKFQGILLDSYSWDDGHHISIGLMGTDELIWERDLMPTPGSENRIR
jgi:hypothetical protein